MRGSKMRLKRELQKWFLDKHILQYQHTSCRLDVLILDKKLLCRIKTLWIVFEFQSVKEDQDCFEVNNGIKSFYL